MSNRIIIRFYPGYEEPDVTKWPFEEMTAEEYGQRKFSGEFDGRTYHVEEVEEEVEEPDAPKPKPSVTPFNTANLTPHDIVLIGEDGQKTVFPKLGIIIRLEEQSVPNAIVPNSVTKKYANPKLVKTDDFKPNEYGIYDYNFVNGRFCYFAPNEDEKSISQYEYVLVSGMTLEAATELWPDQMFIAPDTGSGAVRDEKKQIIGTKNWVVSQKFQEK